MKTSVDLDAELAADVKRAAKITREKPATVLRLAIRAGLPIVTNRHQSPRPEGYFADYYANIPKERTALEDASTKVNVGSEER